MHPAWDKTGRQQDFRTKVKNFYFKPSLIKADKLLCCLKMRTERNGESHRSRERDKEEGNCALPTRD